MAKEAKSKDKALAADRQAPVAPRWRVVHNENSLVVLDRGYFADSSGKLDSGKVYDARLAYPGSEIVFSDPGENKIYVDRKVYDARSDKTVYKPIAKFGKQLGKYDSPTEDPRAVKISVEKTPVRLDQRPGFDSSKIKKIETTKEQLDADRKAADARAAKKENATPKFAARGQTAFGAKLQKIRDSHELTRFEKADIRAVAKRKEKREKAKIVRPKKNTLPYSEKQKAMRASIAASKAATKELLDRRRAFAKATMHSAAIERDRVRRRDKAVIMRAKNKAAGKPASLGYAKGRAAMFAAQRRLMSPPSLVEAGRKVFSEKFARRATTLKKFGKMPLHFAARGTTLAADAKRFAKDMPRSARYPSMGHATENRLRSPVSMNAVSGMQSLLEAHGTSGVRGTSVFATQNTLSAKTYGGPGQGIFFRVDASAVLANLETKFPEAIRTAVAGLSVSIGRKLLDIVEPYVPKDTGLLYSTAATATEQTSGGMVDIAGGEAYPASQMYGVSISYNAPYAEVVYFNEKAAHGEEYNRKHNTSEKGDKETARWIEAAFQNERAAIGGLLREYSNAITAALGAAGGKAVMFQNKAGGVVNFVRR
jgi:hypothetical protein